MEKSSIFDKTKYFIIDMDGTFYLGGNIIPGAPDFITRLRETGRDFYFFTNNSSNNVEVCRAKLAKMGFPVDEQRVIISSHVAADYLNRNYAGKRVYLLGNERLTADLAAAGINLVEDEPDIVLLGFDTTLTYEKLRKAVKFIDGGATYIAITSMLSCDRSELAFIGDRLATDIAIGANHGIPCALVYSGVTTPEEYAKSDIRASVAVDSLGELAKYL